jgi:hypothetical protein
MKIRISVFVSVVIVYSTALVTLKYAPNHANGQTVLSKEQKMLKALKPFNPSDRDTFRHSNMSADGFVTDLTKESIKLKVIWNLNGLQEIATFTCVDDIVSGKFDDKVSDATSYAIEDVKVGDKITVFFTKANDKLYATELRISKRPGGAVPPSRNLPWDRPAYFEYQNAKNDYADGVKVREYELRRLGMLDEAIKLYGKRPGDDKLLAERKALFNLAAPKLEEEPKKKQDELLLPKLPQTEKK